MAAGKDIFGYERTPKPKGVFSTENSMLTFGDGTSAEGYMVQDWSVNYQQQVMEVFELGSNALYWTKGRPTGVGSMNRVIGYKDAEDGNSGLFPKEAYDLCDGGVLIKLSAQGGHCSTAASGLEKLDKQVDLSMDGCVITTIGFSASVQDTRLMEHVQWRFASLAM